MFAENDLQDPFHSTTCLLSPFCHPRLEPLPFTLRLELQSDDNFEWISVSLHVDCIRRALFLRLRHFQRTLPKTLFHQKLVGHQDLPGTQPSTWLLQWLTRLRCILGLTQWVYLPASRNGGLTRRN